MAMNDLPSRRADESCADFYARVSLALDVHLDACDTCSYNRDNCNACDACEVSDDPDMHACNCTSCTPMGFGVQLRRLYEAAQRDAARESRGE